MKVLITMLSVTAVLLVGAPQAQAVDPYPPGSCLAVTQGVTQLKGGHLQAGPEDRQGLLPGRPAPTT